MKIYPFKASYPNLDLIASPDSFFDNVSKEYINYKSAGFFEKTDQKAIYIYRISALKTYTGIICSNQISDIEDGNILGHEHTITEKEQSMLSLMLMRKAMIKPVLLAYEGHQAIDEYINQFINTNASILTITLNNDTESHELWAIKDKNDIAQVKSLFSSHIPRSYIADGHHRSAITARLVKKKYLHDLDDKKHPGLLCAFFPFSDLKIYDFCRVVDFSTQMSDTKFMASLSTYFDILPLREVTKPEEKYQLTMYIHNEWYSLRWKQSVLGHNQQSLLLDVDLFNQHILNDILGIKDIKKATEISYIEGVASIDVLYQAVKTAGKAGFYFYPITKEDVIATSESGGVLPPKSTWFEPRMKNGLVIKEF
ncbi:MAG: DUF1015 domain-containing protein [Saprospiraceae bacterium]|nr:DUF1015 domain-containing protein [Saprospiraceae bacterium]